MGNCINKVLLKKAFDAGRDFEHYLNPYNGKPKKEDILSFTKWFNRLSKSKIQIGNCEDFYNISSYNKLTKKLKL